MNVIPMNSDENNFNLFNVLLTKFKNKAIGIFHRIEKTI